MGLELAKLFVTIAGDAAPLSRSLAGVRALLGGIGGMGLAAGRSIAGGLAMAAGTGGVLTAAAGVAAIAAGIGKSVMAASDLNETLNKSGEIFGASATIVSDAAEDMASKFGISKREFIDGAASLGALAQKTGKTREETAKLGVALAKAAADLGSFWNRNPAEVLQAMQSGLSGEIEPLRKVGIFLSDVGVKSEAAKLGIAKFGAELTEGQKIQARASLILKGVGDAQGDLARTAGGFANQWRALFGRMENAAADLGKALEPISQALVGGLNRALTMVGSGFLGNQAQIHAWAESFTSKVSAAWAIATRFGSAIASLVSIVAPAFQAINSAVESALGAGYAAIFGGASDLVERNQDTIAVWRDSVTGFVTGVIAKIREFGDAVMSFFGSQGMAPIVAFAKHAAWALIQTQIEIISRTFQAIGKVVSTVVDTLIFTLRNWDDITQLVGISIAEKLTNIGEAFSWLMDVAGKFLSWFGDNWKAIGKDAFSAWLTALKNLGTNLAAMGQALIDFLRDPSKGFQMNWTPMLEGFKSTVSELPKIAGPQFTSFAEQYAEVLERIGTREAERAAKKVRDAVAAAKGVEPEAGPKAKPEVKQEEDTKKAGKEKGGSFQGFEEFAKKLQEGALKDKAAEQTAANTQRAADTLDRMARRVPQPMVPPVGGPA